MPSNTFNAIAQFFDKKANKLQLNKDQSAGDQQRLVSPRKLPQEFETVAQIMSGSSKLSANKPPVLYTTVMLTGPTNF
ncbi:UNVERIFIED_CONTAM: hypothetical protein HDU68_003162 [Siphonaria sp. JEL0065]|nr:hypothetical protein HDU68_003162 [Siphonaria sp. JEL0065]